MATTYTFADDVEKIARPLMQHYHEHLADAVIFWVFSSGSQSKAMVSSSRLRFAYAQSGDEPDFLVEIANDDWKARTPEGKALLVDELLCQMGQETNQTTKESKWIINKPDARIYFGALQRHGPQTTEQRQVARIFADLPEQLRMDLTAAPADDDVDGVRPGWEDAPNDNGYQSPQAAAGDDPTRDESWAEVTRPDVSPEALSRIRSSVEAEAR